MSTYKARKEAAIKGNFSHIKLLATSALTAAGLMVSSGAAMADYSWGGLQGDNVAIDTSDANFTKVKVNSGNGIGLARGNADIYYGDTVDVDAKILSVIDPDDISIRGRLQSMTNAQIVLIANGSIHFGDTAEVDVGGLITTTGSISDDQLLNNDFGDYIIENATTGSIQMDKGAEITIAEGGVAAFVAPTVKNAGVINAKIGKVAFAAGEEVTLDLYGDGLFEVAVEGELADAYLENTGEINAAGGTVQMTARAVKDVAENIINLDGVVNVASATQKGGKIVLSGGEQGTVTVSGKLDASGKDGGEITIDAANTLTTASSEIIADGEEEAGRVVLWGRENALYTGTISALGANGFVETSGGNLGVWGSVNLSAGSEWLLDPTNIVIVDGGANTALLGDLTSEIFFSPDDHGPDAVTASPDSTVWIGDTNINAALDNGVNVTFETNTDGTRDGDITVRADADIFKSAGADSTLTFRANDDVIINGSIGSSGAGKLSVVFTADYDGSGGNADIIIHDNIDLNGGDFTATAPGRFRITSQGSINANGGDVNIDQDGVFLSTFEDSISTHTGGKITLNQNVGGSIRNAIASINNGGTGKNTVNVGEGIFAESVLVDRAVDVIGQGRKKTTITPGAAANGFTIDGTIDGTVKLAKLGVDGGLAGVRVNDTADVKEIIINKTLMQNNVLHGVAVFGDSVEKTTISKSDFLDNGWGGGSAGEGDILFYLHNGDITLKNLDIQNNSAPGLADYGIQIRGADALAASGKIELENVKVAGNYRAALAGIQRFDTVDLSMTGVTLGGQTDAGTGSAGWGSLFLSNLGGNDIDLGNTVFDAVTGQYILLGTDSIAPFFTTNNVDATGATFEGVTGATATVAQNFAIEDKVGHKMDDPTGTTGLVTWKAGEFFVTSSTAGIQHAIDAASAGNTVNVDSSTYTEDLTIDKALKLTGHGTTLQSAGGVSLITVTAADVNIDPFTFDGLGTALYGVNANGADNLVIDGNSFTGFVTANANITNSKDVSVKNNTMTGATKGVNGDNVENIKVFDNTITGTTVAGIHIANSNGTGYDGAGKDVDIWGNTVTSAAGTGIFVQNSAFATIGADALNPFASGLPGGNKVSGGTHGIVVENSDNAQVVYSTINNVGGDGVNVSGTANAKILNNIITSAGDDGIGVEFSTGTQIIGNQSTGSTNSGIETFLSGNSTIQGNTVHSAGLFGIHSRSGTGTTLIDGNTINNTGNNGIHDGIGGGPATLGTTGLTISNNLVGLLGGVNNIQANGVYVSNSNGAVINGNFVDQTRINGIYVKSSDDVTVDNNNINNAGIWGNLLSGPDNGTHGIFVADSNRTKLRTNTITNSAQRGIWSVRGNDIDITNNNNIDNSGLQAIATFDVDDVEISGNTGTNSGGQGIAVVNVDKAVISNNTITTTTHDGIFVAKGSAPSNVANNITITGNTVSGTGDNGVSTIQTSGTLNISGNTISNTTSDGVKIDRLAASSTVTINNNASISGGVNGVRVIGDVTGGTTIEIAGNDIDAIADGVSFDGAIIGSTVRLSSNVSPFTIQTIDAGSDGVVFVGDITGSTILSGGHSVDARGGDATRFDGVIDSSRVTFGASEQSNPTSAWQGGNFTGSENGVVFASAIQNGSLVEFTKTRFDGLNGDGIRFGGDLNGSTAHITGANIRGLNGAGVSFDGAVTNASTVKIDNTNITPLPLTGGTIVSGNGNIITGSEDGVVFNGVNDGSTVTLADNVKIEGGTNGVRFAGDVTGGTTIEIARNDIQGLSGDGVRFEGKTSNFINRNEEEILIANNTILGGTNGVSFNGEATTKNDIVIRDNVSITGQAGHGVTHTGGLTNAEIAVTGNALIKGQEDGVQVIGDLKSTSTVDILDNLDIQGVNDDGIHVEDTARAGGVDVNINGNTNIHDTGDNGIEATKLNGVEISNNTISHAGHDGIRIRNFGDAWVSYNDISHTGDDGIDAKDGDFISIYDNYIDLAGYTSNAPGFGNTETGSDADGIHVENIGTDGNAPIPAVAATAGPGGSLYGSAVEIYNNDVANVEDDGIQVETSKSAYINNNIVGHTGDDGVDVDDVETTIVRDNKISSVEDKGITIDGGEVGRYAGVFDNRVLLAGDDGIQVENVYGGEDAMTLGDVVYGYGWSVNVSGNEVAMVGDDGIEVRDSGPTKVQKNDVFMAGMGDDLEGVIDTINTFASLSFAPPPIPTGGPTPIQGTLSSNGNGIIFPNGTGGVTIQNNPVPSPGNGHGIIVLNGAGSVTIQNNAAPSTNGGITLVSNVEDPSFDWTWGEGNGINVHDVSDAYNSPNGWAADVRGNTVKYTGGHGIRVEDNDRTRIKNNIVKYAGLDATTFNGSESMLDVLAEGPFHRSNPGRRDLWASEGSMITIVDNYIGAPTEEPETPEYDNYITISDIEYSDHDGIHAEDIYGQYFEGISGRSYLYDLKIKGNTVKFTGDDGIEVDGAGRTLIAENKIRDAGYGDVSEPEYYGAGDYDGADGIRVSDVSATVGGRGPVPALTSGLDLPPETPEEPSDLPVHEQPYDYEPAENYAVVIRNNDIKRTGDDGIEVVGSGEVQDGKFGAPGIGSDTNGGYIGTTDRVLIAENTIVETGHADNNENENGDNRGADGYGHDGIHVRNVTGTFYEDPSQKQSPGGSYNAYNSFYGYAVDIVKNEVRKTGDDGVEVLNSESTLIANNTIRKAGVKDKTRKQKRKGLQANNTDGADFDGADGISVRNVGGSNPDYGTDGYAGPVDFEPYSVAIVNNDVRKTADDGIEVVGSGTNNWEINVLAQSNDWDDDDAYQYDGTGRTLILENTVRDAGVSGRYGYEDGSSYNNRDGYTSYYREWGNQGSYDGFGGDGISVRGVGVGTNTDPWVPTAGASGGFIGGPDYAVQIIGNDVRRTGDDGIEVVGNNYNSKFGAPGIGGPVGRVLVSENFVKKAGLSGGVNRHTHNSFNDYDDQGNHSGNSSSSRNTFFGNSGNDGYGADGIHVRGVGASNNGYPLSAAGSVGRKGGEYYGYAVDIVDNTVRTTGDDGIEVRDSDSTFIAFNNVKNSGELSGQASSSSSNYRNTRDGYRSSGKSRNKWFGGSQRGNDTGGDGIHVENVGNQGGIMSPGISAGNGFEEYAAVIYRNKVKNSADDGVEVLRSGRTRIEKNKISNSGLASYIGHDEYTNRRRGHSSSGGMITIGARAFDGRGSDGIHVDDVHVENVYYPDVQITDSVDSFERPRINSVEIVGNKIDNSADDGIQVTRSGDTLIGGERPRDANKVSNSGTGTSFGDGGGPRITAIRTLDGEGPSTERFEYGGTGEIDATGGDGINVSRERIRGKKPRPGPSIAQAQVFPFEEDTNGPSTQIRIIGNEVSNSADDGIEVDTGTFEQRYVDTTNVLIDTNDVINSGDNGIALVTGGFAGSEEFSVSFVAPFGGTMNSETIGNTVENSGNNGLLAGGYNHDKVVVSDNTFTNNPTGARFESGEIDLTGDANTFVVTPDFVAPEGFDFVTGMQFELAGSISQPTSLTVKDNTLGSTIFQGFGSRPVGQSFYVRVEDGALLEENGAPTVIDGTFANWDGLVPNNQGNILSLQQLLDLENRIFDADDPALNGRGQIFVGTVPGLNPEDFLQDRGFGQFGTSGLNILVTGLPSTGGPNGANFNNINPAAGEGEEGGESAEELANLEPAAGDEEAACWGDAIDAASAGGTVSYSFGGTLEEAIADASSCGSGSL